MTKKGTEFEKLVEKIYNQISPELNIKRNDRIIGFNSGKLREIDIAIRHTVANHEILIIVQAKDHNKKIDIQIVDAFKAVVADVRASKGVLISSKGFSKTAIKYSKNENIDLLTAHDAENFNWRKESFFPVFIKKNTQNVCRKYSSCWRRLGLH